MRLLTPAVMTTSTTLGGKQVLASTTIEQARRHEASRKEDEEVGVSHGGWLFFFMVAWWLERVLDWEHGKEKRRGVVYCLIDRDDQGGRRLEEARPGVPRDRGVVSWLGLTMSTS